MSEKQNGVCGVECRIIDHEHWSQTLVEDEGKQYHRGVTLFYKPVEEKSDGKPPQKSPP